MALKSNFEATNVISSPFVDEIANPGDAIDKLKSDVDATFKHAAVSAEISRRASKKTTPAKKKSEPTKSGFAGPGLKNRKDFIDNIN